MAHLTVRFTSRRELVVGLAATGLAACAGEGGGVTDSGTEPPPDPIAPITPNADFYVTSCCGTPAVDAADWSLTIRDPTSELATLDLAALDAMAARDREHTLQCIGANPYNHAISNAVWTGLPLVEILAALGVTVPAAAVEMVFTGADDYTTSLPVSDLDLPVWLVWRMNGEPLPPEHGYPARLLVPGRYGMKNPKWIVDLSFVTEPYLGFWESYGWSNEARYKANTLVSHPARQATVQAGPVRVQGTAFAGGDPVVTVEVSVDGGDWVSATLDYAPGADVWTLWHHDWEAEVGQHTVQVRCVTASGGGSIASAEGSDGLEGYDGSMMVEVEAT